MTTLSTEHLPIWNERERPSAYLIDVHTASRDYATVLPDDRTNAGYLTWINGHKESLHTALRDIHPATASSFDSRCIEITHIANTVAGITQQDPYPVQRIVATEDADNLPAYKAAIEDGLFEESMQFSDGTPISAQFEHALHFIRLRRSYIKEAARSDIVNACAHTLGQATLGRIVFTKFEHTPEGTITDHWYGYTWRHDDIYFGEILNEASAAKIAAETRRWMNVFTPGKIASHPLIEAYRTAPGVDPLAIGAIALDVLNHATGSQDPLSIYRPLWEYIASGQQDAARQELARMVTYATKGSMRLEELEAQPYSSKGLSLDMLKKVEECCRLDASMRPSRYLRLADE